MLFPVRARVSFVWEPVQEKSQGSDGRGKGDTRGNGAELMHQIFFPHGALMCAVLTVARLCEEKLLRGVRFTLWSVMSPVE